MPTKDTSEIKERIVSILRQKGPSLPAHIAREIETSILFTSAFLSELIAENRLKISSMRVGSSPVYYLPGQENLLEKYSEHLKSKEKEAFLLIKDKKFLRDGELDPAIRVAIREIKDFAFPFKEGDDLVWRYITTEESEFRKKDSETKKPISKEIKKEKSEKNLEIFDKEVKRKGVGKKSKSKKNEKFLDKVKEFLSQSNVEIVSIEGVKNDELILRVRTNGGEQILVAYNKKRISEKDILKAYKKASELGLKYSVLSMGELPKKMSEMIEAFRNINDIGKVEINKNS